MNTIKDVARVAGVSIATISNFINKTKPVSKLTEAKITEAIEHLNYTPNLMAKSLKSNNYTDIGVILPNLNDSYYNQVFQGIEHTLQGSSHFINLAFSYDVPEHEKNIVDSFLKKNICGLILVTSIPNDWEYYYKNFTSQDKPLVLLDRMIYNLDTTFVTFENKKLLCRLLQPLLTGNKTNVFLFTGSDTFFCEKECIDGYFELYESKGIAAKKENVVRDVLNKEKAFACTIEIMKKNMPDAIITTSALCAAGIIEALMLLGFSKHEIPVYALGEDHWNRFTHSFANNSAVRPAIRIGETAANFLMDQIRSPKTFEHKTVIIPDLFRESAVVKVRPKKNNDVIKILMLETPQTESIIGLIPNFEKTMGVKTQIEVLPHTTLLDRIYLESQGKHPHSDVYMFDIPWLYQLVLDGILADITDYIEDTTFDKDIFLPNCLKYFSEFKNRYYALPFMYAPQILYYRKDLFESKKLNYEYQKQFHTKLCPPKTWKEFNAIAQFFTECDSLENKVDYGTSIPCAYKECMAPELYMRMWSFGSGLFNSKFKVTIDTPSSLKAYISYKSTFKWAKPDYKTATDLSVISDFANGETAMLITYPSFLANTIDMQKNSLIGDVGYSHIPGKTPILGGWSFGINSKSTKQDTAFSFLNWTVQEENANYFTLLGSLPAIENIFHNDELIRLYPWLPLYHSSYKHTEPLIPPYKKDCAIIPQAEIDTIVCSYAMDLIEDHIDIMQAIKSTQKDLEKLFTKYKYLY